VKEQSRTPKRVAAIQSLLATATLNGLDPTAWLRDTLEKLPTCLNGQIDSLLPLRSNDDTPGPTPPPHELIHPST
jgi:IS66 C-terminal element